jgi:S-methylmethionine-dependent homocysteine/selenocysteine methylase
MEQAVCALAELPVSGILANCCAPESIAAAMPAMLASGKPWTGGYGNTFEPVPETWNLGDADASKRSLTLRDDLDPSEYLAHARGWWETGATVVGGCCGTRPAHIAEIDAAWARPGAGRR